jgi:hypothetical protein
MTSRTPCPRRTATVQIPAYPASIRLPPSANLVVERHAAGARADGEPSNVPPGPPRRVRRLSPGTLERRTRGELLRSDPHLPTPTASPNEILHARASPSRAPAATRSRPGAPRASSSGKTATVPADGARRSASKAPAGPALARMRHESLHTARDPSRAWSSRCHDAKGTELWKGVSSADGCALAPGRAELAVAPRISRPGRGRRGVRVDSPARAFHLAPSRRARPRGSGRAARPLPDHRPSALPGWRNRPREGLVAQSKDRASRWSSMTTGGGSSTRRPARLGGGRPRRLLQLSAAACAATYQVVARIGEPQASAASSTSCTTGPVLRGPRPPVDAARLPQGSVPGQRRGAGLLRRAPRRGPRHLETRSSTAARTTPKGRASSTATDASRSLTRWAPRRAS